MMAARLRRIVFAGVLVAALYALLAYLVLPALWTHYEHQRRLQDVPMLTTTTQGISGDPINIGLVGDEADVVCAFGTAGWRPADPLSLRSDIGIAGSVLLDRPDPRAPVSTLLLDGRKQDMAFEKSSGRSAAHRHHVRLWKVIDEGEERRPVWLGSVTFDESVGLSRYTGAVTHHIAPDIDAERALIATDLESAKMVEAKYQVTGIGPTLAGRNGEGDRYFTDGEVWMLRLGVGCRRNEGPVATLPSPATVEVKDALWQALTGALK
jgi:LssY C-terminus